MGKATDFRYNTGATRVPWAAVGENYNVHDLMEIIKFLMQGEGKEYDDALEAVWQQVKKLEKISTPPGKLSLGTKVEAAEAACNEYLGTNSSTLPLKLLYKRMRIPSFYVCNALFCSF